MKKLILFLYVICYSVLSLGQAKPSYTQYILNNFILNPALTGVENYIDVKLSNRHQWKGIDGAPVTSYVTIHGPIGKQDLRTSATSFVVPGDNPRDRNTGSSILLQRLIMALV